MSKENREARRAKWKARRATRKGLFRPLDANDKEALLNLKETLEEVLADGWDADDANDILVAAAELVTARKDTP